MARTSSGGRGGTLIATLIVVAGLTLLAVAALNMATSGTIGAAQKTHADQLGQCANAAAQRIVAEYALAGATVTSIDAAVVPGGPALSFGHFDQGGAAPSFTSVTVTQGARLLGQEAGGSARTDFDTTNTITVGRGGGTPYVFFAHCTDGYGEQKRQYEVELFVRLGLI